MAVVILVLAICAVVRLAFDAGRLFQWALNIKRTVDVRRFTHIHRI